MASKLARVEQLPAKRVHETTPPEDPTDLLLYYEKVIDECVVVAEVEQQRAWLALEEIHRRELWRQTHRSFSAYVTERWNRSRRQAYRQIEWAREVRSLPSGDEVVPRGTTLPYQREAAAMEKAKRDEAERRRQAAIDAASTVVSQNGDDPVEELTVIIDDAEPSGDPPPNPPRPEPEQLALFPVTRLLEEAFNNRRDEVLAIEGSKRAALAKRMRHWADLLDPPPVPTKKASPPGTANGRLVEPMFKKAAK